VGWSRLAYRGSAVAAYIEEDRKIELIYFPVYAPEEDTQEHVWKKGRAHVIHNKFIHDIVKTDQGFCNFLNQHSFPYQLFHCNARS